MEDFVNVPQDVPLMFSPKPILRSFGLQKSWFNFAFLPVPKAAKQSGALFAATTSFRMQAFFCHMKAHASLLMQGGTRQTFECRQRGWFFCLST